MEHYRNDSQNLQHQDSIPACSRSAEPTTHSPNTKNTSFPPKRPRDCRHPRLIRQKNGFVRWQRCGRPNCSRRCRDIWAWKKASSVLLSVRHYGKHPSHFMTLIRLQGAMPTEKEFSGAVSRFFELLKRKVPSLEYLWINEWTKRKGIRHAHALLTTPSEIRKPLLRDVAKRAAIRVRSYKPIRNLVRVVNYIFKNVRNSTKKARLQSPDFRGRLFTASRRFLVKPIDKLWREYRESRLPSEPKPLCA